MTTAPARNLDYRGDAVRRLPGLWQAAPRMRGLAEAVGDALQQVETRFGWPIVEAVADIGAARGGLVEFIGELVGELRNGRTMDVYRAAVAARIQTSRSTGTYPEITSILSLLAGGAARVVGQRGAVTAEVDSGIALTSADEARIRAQLVTALPAGVGLSRVVELDAGAFTLDTEALGLDAGRLARSWA